MEQHIFLTTDCVIFHFNFGNPEVLLVQRKNPPFKEKWALPGGFLEDEEPLEMGARRELEEETGLLVEELHQIAAFGTPGRDPRGRTVSIAFWGWVTSRASVKGADDAADARWFPLDALPELAFDHQDILTEAARLAIPIDN